MENPKEADTLVACGSILSNHCRLTLSAAAKEGLACHLVLEELAPGKFTPSGTGNFFLHKLLGAKSIKFVPHGSDMVAEVQAVSEAVKKQGAKPYCCICIPGGVAYEIGSLGYARCGQEIAEQLEAQGLSIREIIVPSGRACTHAGVITDPVYSGKTMEGLISYVRSGRYAKDESVLFVHTGGVPGLFDYVDVFNQYIEVPLASKL